MKDVMINDVHVGYRTNANWHFNSLKRFFTNQLIPDIIENKYNNVFMLGDWFESRNSATFNRIDESIELLEQIADSIDGKIYMLVGNHDLFYRNDMLKHNFASFKNIPKVEILLGKGFLEFNGKSVFYSSYDSTDNIYKYMVDNKIKADVFFGHVETDGSKVISYINNNFDYGYSGHVHNLEKHENFFWLPSTQQNKTDEVDSIHGYSVIDWDTCKHKMVDNLVSGRFVTINFGDDVTEEIIKNNFVSILIDRAKVKKLSNRKLHQDVIISEFKKSVEKLQPAKILSEEFIDSESENAMQKMLSDSDKIKVETDLIENTNSINNDILSVVAESEIDFVAETHNEILDFMVKHESIEINAKPLEVVEL